MNSDQFMKFELISANEVLKIEMCVYFLMDNVQCTLMSNQN